MKKNRFLRNKELRGTGVFCFGCQLGYTPRDFSSVGLGQTLEYTFFFFFFLESHVERAVFFFFFFNLWLCWVFVSVRGLSLAVASGGHSSSRCAGLSLSRPLLLRSTGSRHAGSVIVAHGPSCSAARGILPDQGSNPCPLN